MKDKDFAELAEAIASHDRASGSGEESRVAVTADALLKATEKKMIGSDHKPFVPLFATEPLPHIAAVVAQLEKNAKAATFSGIHLRFEDKYDTKYRLTLARQCRIAQIATLQVKCSFCWGCLAFYNLFFFSIA